MDETQQYLRVCELFVSGKSVDGLDLSNLRIKFSIKRSDVMTPNVADIRVYNLNLETAILIRKAYTHVVLQAGYLGNKGVIFQGNIKQVIIGRESQTDTFIDIIAGDGDRAYNFAVVNKTLAKGSTQLDQIDAALNPMAPKGVTGGPIYVTPTTVLPRGKVMYGNSRNYLRDVAQSTDSSWSIQDNKVTFVKLTAYLPGERVVLNSDTGMIGTPQQTDVGVNVKCLINPNIRIAGRIEIDNDSIQKLKIDLTKVGSASIPAPLSVDGVYKVLAVEHTGDTRGIEWYSSLICFNVDVTANPLDSVGGTP